MGKKYTEEDLRKAFEAATKRNEWGSMSAEKGSVAVYHNEPKFKTFEDYLRYINPQMIGTL